MQQKHKMLVFSICMYEYEILQRCKNVKRLLDWIEVDLVDIDQEKKELFGLNRSTKDDLSWRLTGEEGNMFCVWTELCSSNSSQPTVHSSSLRSNFLHQCTFSLFYLLIPWFASMRSNNQPFETALYDPPLYQLQLGWHLNSISCFSDFSKREQWCW